MIESQRKKKLCYLSLCLLVASCIAAYLLVFAVTNILGFTHFCDSDMYADTLVAKLMWEQKALFPQGWVFGNQLYIFATPVLAALFYGITGNINWAMVIATEIMTLLIFVSFLWLVRAFSKDLLGYLVFCLLFLAVLIAPHGIYSETSQLFFLQASYYSCYLITFCVVLGDYVRSVQSSKRRLTPWIISLALSFAMGMQSLRQTVIMVLPIFACELLQAFRRLVQKEKPWNRQNAHSLIRSISYGLANLGGLFFVKLLSVNQTTIFGDLQFVTSETLGDRLSWSLQALLQISGLRYAPQTGSDAAFHTLSIFAVLLFLTACFRWLLRIRHPESPLEICWLICLVGIIGVILSTVLLNVALRPIYLFTWFPLVAFSGLIILKRLSLRQTCLAVILACAIGFGNLWLSYVPSATSAIWFGSTSADTMSAWAVANGYEYVYGDWFTSPRIAAPSGGKLVAAYWKNEAIYHPLGYINLENIYGPEENAKAIYVFTSKDLEQGLQLAQDEGTVLTKVAEFGEYHAYTASAPLMYQKSKNCNYP